MYRGMRSAVGWIVVAESRSSGDALSLVDSPEASGSGSAFELFFCVFILIVYSLYYESSGICRFGEPTRIYYIDNLT